MYLVLEPSYRVIFEDYEIYFKNILTEELFKIKANESIDLAIFQGLLYGGVSIKELKSNNCYTYKLLKYLLKSKEELFFVTDSSRQLKKIINCRSVLLLSKKSGCPKHILNNYMQAYDETVFFVVGDINDTLKNFLSSNGMKVEDNLADDELSKKIFLLNTDNSSFEDLKQLNSTDCYYLLYSVEDMTVGPCKFNKNDTYIQLTSNTKKVKENIGSFANVTSLYSIMLNCLLYLISDVHQTLYIDVGLPLQKKFNFHLPELRLTATPVYEGGK